MAERDPRYFKVYQDGDDRELEQKIQQIVESGAAPGIDTVAREGVEEIQRMIENGEIGGGGGGAGVDSKAREDIQQVTKQLAESEKQIEEVTKNPYNYNGAIVTIIDDDIKNEVKTVWQPVLNDTGAKITFACITGWVGTNGYMTLEEIKGLQAQGHEIVSHTVTHRGTADVAIENAATEYPNSQKWLKENGFKGYETLVYPGGMPVNRIDLKDIARKYYKYAISTNHIPDVYNTSPVDSWRVPRIQGDTSTLEQLKSAVDAAISNNGWVILMTHSHVVDSQKMRDFINYVKSRNVPIMPFGEAAKYKGNVMAIGEFSKDDSTFVGADGSIKAGGSLIIKTDSKKPMDDSITTYKKNTKTVVNLSSATDTFLNVGGAMEVYRAYHDSLSYATFTPTNSHKQYRRTCNYTTGTWNQWVDLATTTYSTGTWTPVLKGTTVAGTHTYARQEGRWTKFANMIVVTFTLRVEDAGKDANMSGALQISGLPSPATNTFALPVAPVQYNHLTLPPNYSNVIIKPRISANYLDLFISGNGVGENYLNATHITPGQAVVFTGQIMYAI